MLYFSQKSRADINILSRPPLKFTASSVKPKISPRRIKKKILSKRLALLVMRLYGKK